MIKKYFYKMKKFVSLLLFISSYSCADYCQQKSFINYFKSKSLNTSCVYTGFSKTETISKNNNTELFRIKYFDNSKISKIILSNISHLYFLTRNNSSCTIKPYPLSENIEKNLSNNANNYNCHGIPASIDKDEFYSFVNKCVIKGSLKDYGDYSHLYIYTYVTVDRPDEIQQNYLVCNGEYSFFKCKWNMTFDMNCSYHPSIFNKIFGNKNNITTEKNIITTEKNIITIEKNNITTEKNNITTEKNIITTEKNNITIGKNNTYSSLNEKYIVTPEEIVLIVIGILATLGFITLLLISNCVKKNQGFFITP